MSDDSKTVGECLFGVFTLYSVFELVRGARDAWIAGSKVFASVPNDLLAAYPQLKSMIYEGVIPLLQKNMQPHEFEQLTQQVTQFMTTYHDQIVIFTPLAAAILAGLGVLLYQLILILPIFVMGVSVLDDDLPVFLLAGAFGLAIYWPSVLITISIVCAIGYFVLFFFIPIFRSSTRRT
jgi:hypothetical protein